MSGELNLFGIFFPPLLLWALVAGVLGLGLRRLLGAVGAYRWVWHPALFDLALFVLLLGAVTALGER